MYRLNIELLDIKYISNEELVIKIYYNELKKVMDNKTIYEIKYLKKEGLIKIKESIFSYKYIIIFIIVSLTIIYFLSNLIFYVEIVTNDKLMQKKISNYLSEKGIKKYHFKKSYSDISKIKKDILDKYKNEIDWIEIELKGSKYIIKYEPRIITDMRKKTNFQNIISTKNAIINSMNIKNGQIIKNRYEYVKKGDVIVSGYIYVNDKINDTVRAEGSVYGETFYKVRVKYPLKYKNIVKTKEHNKVLTFKFINSKIDFFDFKKYKNYNYKDTKLLFNNILPISLVIRDKRKLMIYEENNNYQQALKKAVKCAKREILKKLDDKEYIKKYQILKEYKNNGVVEVEVFFSVIEKISIYSPIEEYKDIGNINE